jgi:hypothetical protein
MRTPNLEGQVPIFISPRNRVIQLYAQALGTLFIASYYLQGHGGGIRTYLHARIRWSVKLLLVFRSTVIPGSSLLRIHDQDFYSLLDMYMFQNGASSLMKEGSVFLCRQYILCTVVSA